MISDPGITSASPPTSQPPYASPRPGRIGALAAGLGSSNASGTLPGNQLTDLFSTGFAEPRSYCTRYSTATGTLTVAGRPGGTERYTVQDCPVPAGYRLAYLVRGTESSLHYYQGVDGFLDPLRLPPGRLREQNPHRSTLCLSDNVPSCLVKIPSHISSTVLSKHTLFSFERAMHVCRGGVLLLLSVSSTNGR